MPNTSDVLGSFAGATGVGALCVLAMFLFFDGRASNLLPNVEAYAKTATWAIVAAVPVLAMSYIVGLLLISGAESAVARTFGPTADVELADLARVAKLPAKDSVAVQRFAQLRQDRAILAGSAVALLLLAFGALSEIRNLPELKTVIVCSALVAILVAAATFFAAAQKGISAHLLAEALAQIK